MRSTLTIGQACANWLAGRYGLRKSAKAAYRNGLQPLRDRTALDLDAGTLKVAATISRIGGRLVISKPKTERSRREVPLHPSIVTMLRKHRVAQKAEKLHVYCGINYRVTDLPFIQTWWYVIYKSCLSSPAGAVAQYSSCSLAYFSNAQNATESSRSTCFCVKSALATSRSS